MTARVSVIIPTYNRAAWLPRTVASVRRQTHAPHEIIVVDDGSQDDTAAVVAGLGAGITLLTQANQGVAAARNLGARHATGDWLAFVDSDDLWEPEKLEIQLAASAEAPNAPWCVTGCQTIGFDDRPAEGPAGFAGVFPIFRQGAVDPEAFFRRWLEPREIPVAGGSHLIFVGDMFRPLFGGNFGLPSSLTVRREWFFEVGGFDPAFRLAEETEFFHRAAARAPGIVVFESLVGYRVAQAGSLISSANVTKLVRNARESGDRAARLRELTPADRSAHRDGRRSLTLKLVYGLLSDLDTAGARKEWMAQAGTDRLWASPKAWGLLTTSMVPPGLLRSLHRLKRSASRA
jgi:glycosyltransferase involved in cell wall biosynthesis